MQKTEAMPGARPSKTINLSTLHTRLNNGETPIVKETTVHEAKRTENKEFTPEQLKAAWMRFAETKKNYKAEYQLLMQPFEVHETTITLPLHHPVQETLLNNLRSDLAAYLRNELSNQSIQVLGEMRIADEKQILYTNREKFDFLSKKNPILKELKDRLGLDTDF
ncbi:MAG: hypothetical protein ACK4RF_02205 [Cyclobacteriaceae bacterium]